MARYLRVAQEANDLIHKTISVHRDITDAELIALLGKLYNLGIRTSPRPCQSTVRLNAVSAALKGTPIKAQMTKVRDPLSQRDFNALSLINTENNQLVSSDASTDDE